MPRRTRQVTVPVIGMLTQGIPITTCDGHVTIPADRIEAGEVVYRIGGELPEVGLAADDLLIVQPRQRAATGEFVIATRGDHVFVGRWWAKHGTRKLLDDEFRTIADAPELVVLGAVTLIVRAQTR